MRKTRIICTLLFGLIALYQLFIEHNMQGFALYCALTFVGIGLIVAERWA